MNIYVASSWRNDTQPIVVNALREDGHCVYDFKNPPNKSGFAWRETDPEWPSVVKSQVHYLKALEHRRAVEGFNEDMSALKSADITVLVLPCGRSAHLELGYAVGEGQHTYVLLDNPLTDWDLMYKMCTRIVTSIYELRSLIRTECKL